MEFSNNENEIVNTSQAIYDDFNSFIFSNDTRVLAKLVARTILFKQTIDVPGDIVECGVFKGSGILTWLKLKKILSPNTFRKIIGFDFFNTKELLASLDGLNRERMENLFVSRKFTLDDSYLDILKTIIAKAGFNESSYELISGDISITSKQFIQRRPGAKISLLYLDLDLEKPTYDVLDAFWERISYGGLVVFDEYAYHQWSETKGVDRFFEPKKIKIRNLDFNAPTAYVIKE
jgi:hypothetical protein